MRKVALAVSVALAQAACTSTTYVVRDPERMDVRFSDAKPGEKHLRSVKVDVRHNYYLFGLIPAEHTYDLTQDIGLKSGQALVNARIENSFDGIDALIFIGLGVISAGIIPAIWTTRSTTIQGEVVKMEKASGKEAKKDDDDEDDEPDAPVKEPARPKPVEFTRLERPYAFGWAKEACGRAGGKLPTRAALKANAETARAGRAGNVWTADEEGDDAWTVDVRTGAAFLKSKDDEYNVLCATTKGP